MKGIYIVGGYPDITLYEKQLGLINNSNIDFVEIGLPFNDPVADGNVIARAINEVSNKGYKIENILELATSILSNKLIYVMTYANIIYKYGADKFSSKYKNKVNGIIIADLPNRMHSFFYKLNLNIKIIPFLTLESREEDIDLINRSKADFAYFIGIRGTTGGKLNFENNEIRNFIKKVKPKINKKIIFGFGLKNRDDIEKAMILTDGIVVGTEIVKKQPFIDNFQEFLKIF